MKYIDKKGVLHIISPNGINEITYNIKGMFSPVICSFCGKVYDLQTVKINHRFQDCDQFTTPCCGYEFADTRVFKNDFKRIEI